MHSIILSLFLVIVEVNSVMTGELYGGWVRVFSLLREFGFEFSVILE